MIDTHAHLADRFKQEVDLTGLGWVVLAASSVKDSKDNLKLAKTNKKLLPAIGIHPLENDKTEELEKLMTDEVVAIGECGLELVGDFDREKQIKLFEQQIKLSLKYQKPLIVHARKAADETVEILKSYQGLRGVIHCYTGGKKRIKKYLEISDEWYFGIDGNVTYEIGLEEVVREIPKDRLLAETDTPFLAPIPHRGEVNKPTYVEYVYKKIAGIWGLGLEETEKIIDQNSRRLFSLVQR